jgi:hypothetical protein
VPQRALHRARHQGADGYGAERFRIEPEFAVKVAPSLGILGVLLEPASILAKAWDHTDGIGHRARVAAADLARHRCRADRGSSPR